MSTTFPGFNADNCTPLFYEVDGSSGATITRMNIRPFTETDFAAQDFKEVGMDKIIAQTKMARTIGVKQSMLNDLVLSRMTPYKTGTATSQSIVAPYRLVPRRSLVNINYFLVTAGSSSAPADPATPFPSTLPATAYYFTVQASTGGFGSAITNLEKYFLPGTYISVTSTARYTGAAWQTYVDTPNLDSLVQVQYRVVAAVGKSGDTSTAYVVVAPTDFQSYEESSAAWTTYKGTQTGSPSPEAMVAQTLITEGTAILLANSVSDFEAWCYQTPAVNNLGLKELWRQTLRWTFQYNDEYLKALNAPNMSEFYRMFRTLPVAEQMRQQQAMFEKMQINTIFFGKRISDKQTVATWTDLPQIEDVTNPGQYLEVKANTLGFFTQLGECGKVLDVNGAPLNIDTIRELCYNIKRERENDGTSVSRIDFQTDRFTKSLIRSVMIDYHKKRSGIDAVNANVEMDQQMLSAVGNHLAFKYDKFDLPDEGLDITVTTDTFFDDRIGAFKALGSGTPTKDAARQLWIIDWSDLAVNVMGNRSVTRQTNQADNLYNCVMSNNVNHYKLNSRTIEVDVGNVNRHAVLQNFSNACPTMAPVAGCTVSTTT